MASEPKLTEAQKRVMRSIANDNSFIVFGRRLYRRGIYICNMQMVERLVHAGLLESDNTVCYDASKIYKKTAAGLAWRDQ